MYSSRSATILTCSWKKPFYESFQSKVGDVYFTPASGRISSCVPVHRLYNCICTGTFLLHHILSHREEFFGGNRPGISHGPWKFTLRGGPSAFVALPEPSIPSSPAFDRHYFLHSRSSLTFLHSPPPPLSYNIFSVFLLLWPPFSSNWGYHIFSCQLGSRRGSMKSNDGNRSNIHRSSHWSLRAYKCIDHTTSPRTDRESLALSFHSLSLSYFPLTGGLKLPFSFMKWVWVCNKVSTSPSHWIADRFHASSWTGITRRKGLTIRLQEPTCGQNDEISRIGRH